MGICCWNALQSLGRQLNTVLFLSCLSDASHVAPSVKAWWLLSVVKKGCSVSESVFMVSQMNQTISRRDPGDQECWD